MRSVKEVRDEIKELERPVVRTRRLPEMPDFHAENQRRNKDKRMEEIKLELLLDIKEMLEYVKQGN